MLVERDGDCERGSEINAMEREREEQDREERKGREEAAGVPVVHFCMQQRDGEAPLLGQKGEAATRSRCT
jgi:hypothetical protein